MTDTATNNELTDHPQEPPNATGASVTTSDTPADAPPGLDAVISDPPTVESVGVTPASPPSAPNAPTTPEADTRSSPSPQPQSQQAPAGERTRQRQVTFASTPLHAMFPDFDEAVLCVHFPSITAHALVLIWFPSMSVLESVGGNQELAIDQLLGMSDPDYISQPIEPHNPVAVSLFWSPRL
jgi:hypothetical protein